MRRAKALFYVLLLTASSSASAAVVFFSSGHMLKVESYRVDGDKVHLAFGGGEMVVSLAVVEQIFDDEVVAPPPGFPGGRRPPTRLDFRPGMPVPEAPFGKLIHRISRRYGLNPQLIVAIVETQSGFDPEAVADTGARGLLQLMPITAAKFRPGSKDLLDPAVNLEAGCRYLNWLRKQFGDDLDLVLAGFSAGADEVRRHGGVPPYRGPQEFIDRVYEALEFERPSG